MKTPDRALQRKVWQRVLKQEADTEPEPPLQDLLRLIKENILVYQQLSRRPGRNKGELELLRRQSLQMLRRTESIFRFRGEKPPAVPSIPGPESPGHRLQACYHRERRLWEAFSQMHREAELTPVWASLAQTAGEHCALLWEMINS